MAPVGPRPAGPEILITRGPRSEREGHDAVLPGQGRSRRRRPHHGDTDLVARPRRSGLSGPASRAALSGRERAAPDRRPGRATARPRGSVRTAPGTARFGRVPSRRGSRDHGPQELRGNRIVHPRGPAAGARPPRLLEPARLQHVPQRPAPRPGARRRRRPGLRRGTGAQPGHARVLLGRPPPPAVALCAAVRPRDGARRLATPWSRARPPSSSPLDARRATHRVTWTSIPSGRRPKRQTSRSSFTSAGRPS